MTEPDDLQKDESGNIITNPLTGWQIAPVAGIAVLLIVQYAKSELDLETGNRNALQLILTPQQCLELAEVLTKQAKNILGERLPPGKSPN